MCVLRKGQRDPKTGKKGEHLKRPGEMKEHSEKVCASGVCNGDPKGTGDKKPKKRLPRGNRTRIELGRSLGETGRTAETREDQGAIWSVYRMKEWFT